MYRVWSLNFPMERNVSPCDRLYRPHILTSGSVGCPDPFAAAFALALQTDEELLRHMGHVDLARHNDPSPTAIAFDSPSSSPSPQDTFVLAPRPSRRAFVSTPDIWVLEDPSLTVDEESCADEVNDMRSTSGRSTPELSLGQSPTEFSEQPSVVDSVEPHVKVANSEVDTVDTKATRLSSLPTKPLRKPRRAQQKKNPALLQAWSNDAEGYRNLDQTNIQSWVPALQRVSSPHPNPKFRPKQPWRKWARPTPGPSKSAALEVNKLAARRSRKTKKEWITQRERMGHCLRRLIEMRLAEIAELEAEVVRLKAAIARCGGCTSKYRTSWHGAGEGEGEGEDLRRRPINDLDFEWIQVEPSS